MTGPLLTRFWRRLLGVLVVILVGLFLLLANLVGGGRQAGLNHRTEFHPAAIGQVRSLAAVAEETLRLQVRGENLAGMTQAALVPDIGNRHQIRAQLPLWGQTRDVAVSDGHAYIANNQRGLVVVDLSGREPTICGSLPLPGKSWSVALAGNLALVSALTAGLHVVDVSQPDRPELLATIPTRDRTWGAFWDGERLYLANGNEGLLVYDLQDPQQPRLLAALDTPGSIVDVLVTGARIFLADLKHGIRSVVFHAGVLAEKELLPFPHGYWKLAYDPLHQVLLGAAGINGLSVISVPDGGRVELLEQRNEVGFCATVAIFGEQIYAGTPSSVMIYRFDPGRELNLLGEVRTRSRVYGISSIQNTLVLASLEFGLELVDRARPLPLSQARQLSNLRWVSDVDLSAAGDLLVSPGGDLVVLEPRPEVEVDESVEFEPLPRYASVWGDRRWAVLNVGNARLQITPADSFGKTSVWLATRGVVSEVQIRDDLLLVADTLEGLLLYDLSGPEPVPVGQLASTGSAMAMALEGELLYLADGLGGLKIVDIASPATPRLLAALQWPGKVVDVAVKGGQAYLVVAGEGIVLVDCHDPRHPVVRGTPLPGTDFLRLERAGDRLVVSHRNRPASVYRISPDGALPLLQLLDATDGPTLLAKGDSLVVSNHRGAALYRLAADGRYRFQQQIEAPRGASALALAGDELLLLDGSFRLFAYPWNNGSPGKAQKQFSRQQAVVTRNGDTVFLAHQNRLELLDFTNPASPVTLSQTWIDGEVQDLLYLDGLLVAAMGVSGLQIYEVGDPARVRPLGHFAVEESVKSLARYGSLLVMTDSRSGIKLVDLSRPEQPRLVSRVSYPEPMRAFSSAMAVAVQGDLCYVADGANGLTVIDLKNPLQPEIVRRAEIPGYVAGVEVAGNRAYVLANEFGVHIFDLNGGSNPVPVAAIPLPRSMLKCWQRNHQLLAASPAHGLYILPAPEETSDIEVRGDALELVFPKRPPAGYYALQLFGGDLPGGAEKIIHIDGAARVSMDEAGGYD